MFEIVDEPIDAAAVRAKVLGPENGAVLVFHGAVRQQTADRDVTHLEYEAYGPMALTEMQTIADEVRAATGISALACTHRIGRLEIGDDAMVVAVSSPHRAAALRAVEDFIAALKQRVPIWKKEYLTGGAVWIGTPDDPQGTRSALEEANDV